MANAIEIDMLTIKANMGFSDMGYSDVHRNRDIIIKLNVYFIGISNLTLPRVRGF